MGILYLMPWRICESRRKRLRKGRTLLMGVDEITFMRVPCDRVTVSAEHLVVTCVLRRRTRSLQLH